MDALLARLQHKRDRLDEEIRVLLELQRRPAVPPIINQMLQDEWLKLADVLPGATPAELVAFFRDKLETEIDSPLRALDQQKIVLLSAAEPRVELERRLDEVLAEREKLIQVITTSKPGEDIAELRKRKQELQLERDSLRDRLRQTAPENDDQLEELKLKQKKLRLKRSHLVSKIERIEQLASAASAIGWVLVPYEGKARIVRPRTKKPTDDDDEPQLKRIKDKCDYCATRAAIGTCAGCNRAAYCGRECQTKDHSRHSKSCVPAPAAN